MKNKKVIIGIVVIFVIIVISLVIFFLNQKTSAYKLVLTEYTWSEYGVSSNKIVREFDVKEGNIIYSENSLSEDVTLTITKVDKDAITIETNQPMSCNSEGIDLNTTETKFVVKNGEKTILTTPTMDAGTNYELELK